MTVGIDCEWARRHFPDLADGSADAKVSDHVDRCADCGREWRAFEAVLRAAEELSRHDVPDPGLQYWDGFLPSVRARIGRGGRRGSAATRGGLAAAAALILLAALGSMMLPGPPVPSDVDVLMDEAVSASLDDLLDPDPTAGLAIDMPEVNPEEIMAVIDDLSAPAGISGLWADEDLERMLRALDEEQAARLKEEIAGETG